jgi:hypothetical protein
MVLFFLTNIVYSQSDIQGFVKDATTNVSLRNVNILIKTKDGALLDYTFTNEEGFYKKRLPKEFEALIIEASILSYKKEIIALNINPSKGETYILNFSLNARVDELDEVYIQGKKPPISVKKDTTVYNIEKFKDGTERVVEDILKKLPGITVEENGMVRFKGKTVTRLLLDNDNIFDSNYSIGTKNISSDIIESIEAFEDYDDNPLLKGVKSSQDVALNLKLKKGKADLSGNAELGLGLDSKQYAKLNSILVSKKTKGFSSIGYNNIGENYSPFNFVSNNIDISKLSELTQRTSNLVNENGFNSILPDNRTRVNDNFFGSVNSLFKIQENLSLRVNFNQFKDRLVRNEKTTIIYGFDNETININTSENIKLRPSVHSSAYNLIYKLKDTKLLTSDGKLEYKKIERTSTGFNNNDLFSKEIFSRDVFFTNNIEYTSRFKKATVLQASINVSTNNLPQNVDVTIGAQNPEQHIDFKRNTIDFNTSVLTKIKSNELALSIGYIFDESFVDSELQGVSFINQSAINNLYYQISKPYLNLDYNYRLKKWGFITNLKSEFFQIKLNDFNIEENYEDSFFMVYPELTVNYYFNKKSNLYATYNLSNQIPEARFTFSGVVLSDYRSLLNNDFSFNLFNNHSYKLGYRINDFYNLFQFNIYSSYNYSKFGYLARLNIDENINFSTSIVEATDNENYQLGFRLEKYLHFLRTTFNINSNYGINKYQNLINDSELRNNISKNLFVEFKARTGFKSPFNFENKLSLNNNYFETDLGGSNEFTSLRNDFTIKYVKNDFQFTLDSQYFKPDVKSNITGDLFLDASISLTSKNKKVEYRLRANNLLNQNTFRNIGSSDLSTSTFEHNLQERFILFSVGFRF